jgi:trehalose synthase
MQEIEIADRPLKPLLGLVAAERRTLLEERLASARKLLDGKTVWNVNATAHGGGVAEMLPALLGYGRGVGLDMRWLVLSGDPEFFAITKRVHNHLHGVSGDGGPLGDDEHTHFDAVLRSASNDVSAHVRSGDVVILHDPQTVGLVDAVQACGARAVWRCHIGRDKSNDLTDLGWSFLRPYVEGADFFVFSRGEYVPDWVPEERTRIIAPSIDPFTLKNRELAPGSVSGALTQARLVASGAVAGDASFRRDDKTAGQVRAHRDLIYGGGPAPSADAQLVIQVSRWDRLKDMSGVLSGFVKAGDELPHESHLMLVGPEVAGVSDDPEGAEVYAECQQQWRELPEEMQQRIHLVCLPMDDGEENAHLVNALQHHATVVVQKSLVEGFGLTVTEAMWKGRPLVASAIGGIPDQIVDGRDGLLLHDPEDLGEFGSTLAKVLQDQDLAARLGKAAKARVREGFLPDRHLLQYLEMLDALVT